MAARPGHFQTINAPLQQRSRHKLHTFLLDSSHVRPSHFSLNDSKLNCMSLLSVVQSSHTFCVVSHISSSNAQGDG
jgi:hypothetical protein